MKKSLFLMLFLSTGIWAAEEPMPESCQKFVQIPQIIAEVLDENNPRVKGVITTLEKFTSEIEQEWERLQAAKASGKYKASDLQEAGRLIEENCTLALQKFSQILNEALEAKKQ